MQKIVLNRFMITCYRIYDHTDQETLADSLDNIDQANETLYLLQLQYPYHDLEIEKYTKYLVKGLGRDPDLH